MKSSSGNTIAEYCTVLLHHYAFVPKNVLLDYAVQMQGLIKKYIVHYSKCVSGYSETKVLILGPACTIATAMGLILLLVFQCDL